MESIKAMYAQVGDLCFTADGIAKKGVMVQHLVMPGMENEGKEIMKWLAHNVSPDIMVHVMEQYFPRAHMGKERRGRAREDVVEPGGVQASYKAKKEVRYADINRPVDLDEVASVKKAARSQACGHLSKLRGMAASTYEDVAISLLATIIAGKHSRLP
jgi:putative pyruvate formate lyase activating enzyme